MSKNNTDYLNFQVIDPNTGLTPKEDYKNFKVLEGSSDSRYEPVKYVGDLIEGKSKYDTNLTEEDLENVELERALKQPTGAKAFNSVVGGLASGVLTAIQDVGYLLDFENNFKTLAGLEEVSENWLGQIMREGKEKISEGLPIYRQSNEVFDWDDPGFYFSALKGIIDSAVGFGLPGLGATKAVGSLQKALKLTQLFKMSEPIARVANSIGAGALTNFMEGKTMAVEQFENSVEAMKQNLTKTIFEDLKQRNPDLPANQLYSMAVEQTNQELSAGRLKEFEGIAGKEANKFMLRNTAFMLTDAIGLHGLYKGEGFTRGLLKEKGLQTWAKSFGKLNEENMLLQGAKEYGEEVSQNVLQKEAEYQSAKKSGADVSGTPENLSQRVFDFAFSDQAQLEGLMGFFGGGPQRIMMEVMSGNFGAEAKKRYQKTYDAQQDIVKENTDFINAKLGDYVKWQNLRNDAIKDGRSDLDEYLKNTSLLNLAGKNFRNQTTENLIRQLEDVAKGVSEDERLTHGWDENYQQQARDQVEEVKRLEKEFLRHTKYENQLETFTNRETKRILEKEVQLLKNEISTIDTDLELQEVKDTDLLNRKKTFEKDLSDATERIKQTEETFKEITKAEYQRKLVKERKEKEKGIREALNQITDQIKKEAATQKANNANNNINIKDEISKENIPSEAFNKPDEEIETNKVPDEVLTDKDIDRDNDTVDDDLTSLVNKNIPAASKPVETLTSEPVSEDEKQLAEELLENLKDYIPADVVESIPEGELSNAAVEGTDLSPEQKTLGILQNFIEAIKKSKKSEDISFDDLIARMLQILPKERVASSFMALQDIFNFTQSSKQIGTVKRTNYRNLEEWSKLTPDERIALNSSITISKLLTIDQYTASSEEEINKSLDQLESETDKLNNENAAVDEYDYLRVEFAGNIIAYLSRDFNQIRNKRTEISNDLNVSMQDKKILDPDLYKEGTEITLRLEDNPNTPDYVHGTENKQKTTWGANKDHWNSQLKSGLITQEKYDELIRDNVPIGIYAGEQKIGYLHNVEWIKPSNVVEDGIEESIAVNRKVRNHVIANKEFTTKITKRTPGYLFRSVSGPVSTTQALPDKNLTIAVVKNGTLYTKRKTEYPKSTLNKSLKEGCTYVIVPVGEEEFALPLLHNKIGDQENVVKTIRKAIEIFYYDTYDKNVQDKAFVDAIADKMRINIRQAVGLSEFIRQFVNLYDVGEHRNTDHPMQSFIKSNTTIKQQGDVFLTTFAREATNDLQLEIGRGGMESGVRTLSKAARAKISSQRFNTYVDEVIGMLRDAYFQTNLDNINTDKELVILNDNNELETVSYTDHLKRSTRSAFLAHNIADEGQPPRYVYTIQPVISFDDSGADESLKVDKVQIIPAEETKFEDTEKVNLEKIQKYTLNRKSTDKPLALNISPELINWKETGIEGGWDSILENIGGKLKSLRLLETRGRNSNGVLVGTVMIVGTEGSMTLEVFFNEPVNKFKPEQPDLLKLYTPREVLDMALSEGMMTEKDHADYVRRGDGTDFLESFDVYFDTYFEQHKKKPSEKLRSAAMYSRRHYLQKDDSVRQALIKEAANKQSKKESKLSLAYDDAIKDIERRRQEELAEVENGLGKNRDSLIKDIEKAKLKGSSNFILDPITKSLSIINGMISTQKDNINEKYDAEIQKVKDSNKIQIKDNVIQKPKPVYKKTAFKYNQSEESDYAEASDYLGEAQLEKMEEETEVSVDKEGNVTGVRIKDFNAGRQQQIVDYIQKKITESVFENENRVSQKEIFSTLKKTFEDSLQTDKNNLEIAKEANETQDIQMFQNQIEYFEQIIANWDTLTALAHDQLNRIKEIVTKQNPNDSNDAEEGDEEGIIKGNEGWADADYLKNPEEKLSGQVKELFSGITEYLNDIPVTEEEIQEDGTLIVKTINPYGTPKLTYFGAEKTLSFQEVYSTLQGLTANLRGDYESIIKTLEKHRKVYPWLGEVIEKLEKSTRQDKFAFTTAMTNHYVGMQYIMFTVDPKSGAFGFTRMDSDANEKTKKILQSWEMNLLMNSAHPLEKPDEYIIPKELRDAITYEFETWDNNKKHPPEAVRAWLDGRFGITFNDLAWKSIVEGEFYTDGKRINYLTFIAKIRKLLYENVKKRGASPLSNDTRIIEGTFFKDLAKLEARYSKIAFTNSHRSGKKTVYSYANNKFLVTRLRELKENSNDILGDLKKLSFNGKSAWLEAMHGNTEEENKKFLDNFTYQILSLEPLKKKGAKSRDNNEMYRLSRAEIETVKLGFLQSLAEDQSGNNQRVISLLYPSTSDKTTVMLIQTVAQELKLSVDGKISNESLQKLYNYVVVPEINRMLSYQKRSESQRADLDTYKKGAANLFLFFPELNKVRELFTQDGNIYPDILTDEKKIELVKNKVKEYFDSLVDEKLKSWNRLGLGRTKDEEGKLVTTGLSNVFLSGKKNPEHNPLFIVNEESKVRGAAADMVFQYLIGNAEIAKLFVGDPALYYKQAKVNSKNKRKFTDPDYNFTADAKETYININKRLAADIAPGVDLANSEKDEYIQAFAADFPAQSLMRYQLAELLDGKEAVKELKELDEKFKKGNLKKDAFKSAISKYISAPYFLFDSTDAQEVTTWEEHLKILWKSGKLTDQEHTEIYQQLKDGKKIDEIKLGIIFQPIKPVYVDNKIDVGADIDRRLYIKSSSFPLLPQLTRGTQLDNLRIAMEKQGVHRLAYSTAVKVGNISEPIKIFDDNGNILPADQIDFTGKTLKLNRKGFRIQQDVPIGKVTEINKVSQASKNLLINMLDVDGFKVAWYKNGESIKGSELQEIYHERYNKLHKLYKERLLKELTNTETGNIDRKQLRDILLQEVRERSYPISNRELLELDKNLDLLAFSPASDKFESLLNSIVNNRIIKVKMPGKSYVLGSEEGFKGVKVENKEEISKRKEIIFTSSYDPETGLKPARIEDGVRKPSQAILPWKIKDQKGHIVDLKQFINEKNELDTSKIDPEILNLFGMRIPNQGPNSQGLIEIVGFLPKESGDLIIATRDFVVQMGSDFDVDKLYTYMYYTYVDGEGDIKIQRNKGKYEEETLKNEIIDIHLAIHRNPDPVVQKQIATPLGTWELERIANDIYEKRNLREQTAEGTLFTGLSDEYQTRMFKEATMSKSGVSVFSLDSMFNALAQGKNLVLTKKTAGNRKPVSITLGNKTSEGNLSDIFALDGQTYKSDVIAGYQSAAVDNVKLQILAKLNINNNTFKVIKLLNQLGFGEEVPWFIAQDIVVDYCEELERLGSSLTGYTADKETQAYENVLNNEKYKTNSYNVKEHGKFATTEATVENLASYIEKGENAPNYRLAQRAILDKFIEFGELGQKIQTIQTTINPDSAGLGKSVFESLIKEDKVFELLDSDIINASTLVGEIKAIKNGESEEDLTKDGYIIRNYKGNRYAVKPKTINGFAIAYGLFTNNELWGDFFPYREPAVEAMFEEIELLSGSKDTFIKNKAERRKEMWNEFKSFLFTKESLGLYEGRIMDERRRLLFDVFEQQTVKEENKTITRRVQTHESLASIIAKLKNTPFGKQKLITLLEPEIKINGDRSLVKFNAASAEGSDEGIIYASLIDMLLKKGEDGKSPKIGTFNGKEYTARDIAQDLISYCYITGGIQEAIQFVKYVPAAYLHVLPFFEELSNFRNLETEFSTVKPDGVEGYYTINPFVLQYFQHNPEKVIQLKESDLVNPNSKDKDDITSFGITDKIKESIGLIIEDTVYEPALVTLRNSKSNSGLSLFRFDLKTKKYQKIDTLGSFGYAEYDYQAKEQTSLLKDNRTRKEPVKVAVVKEVKVPVVETESKNLIDQISSGKLTSSTKQNGIEIAKEILNDIILTGNDTNKVVAEMLYERIDYLPESLVFKIAPLKEAPSGTFFYRYSGKRKENGNTLLLNSDRLKSKDRDYIAHVILHELIHGVTGYKLRLYELEESIVKGDEGAQTNYDTLIKAVPKFALTENDREVIKSLTVLFNQIKNKLLSDDVFRTAYDKYLVENKKPVDTRNLTVEQISNFYGLTDLTEFVTMALTDKGFQNLLNSTTLDNGKTFLQALKERIIKLLKSIGFDIKEGSALEASLFQMLDVLELQKPKTFVTSKSKPFDLAEEEMDVAQLMREMEDIGSKKLPGEDEELEFEGSLYPTVQKIVPDKELDKLMKHCKGK